MTSSESEVQISRKRPRTSISAAEDITNVKKTRGRPRVDTQDATAAERRRTQIRLAQRAYRQRKESTIASLKGQSSNLHSIIEQMNKTFLQLNESAQASGLLQIHPGFAQEFKRATETFVDLAKTASEGQYDGDEDQGEATEIPNKLHEKYTLQTKIEIEKEHVLWGYTVPVTNLNAEHDAVQQSPTDNLSTQLRNDYDQSVATSTLVRHRQSAIGDILGQQNVVLPQQTLPASNSPQQLPFGLVELISQQHAPYTSSNPSTHLYSVEIPTPEATPPSTRLPSPLQPHLSVSTNTPSQVKTFSGGETSFARRLTRRALEAGLQLLRTGEVNPVILNRVFGLSLPFFTQEQLRTRFERMLARDVNEDLDWWETPFIQLGGAGTHYPRRDPTGRPLPSKNAWRVRQAGPLTQRSVQIEHALDGRLEILENLDLRGFEGEWFDACDVQGYLEEEYACKVDPGSSFAECLVEAGDNSSSSDQTAISPPYGTATRRASREGTGSGILNSPTSSFTPPDASLAANTQLVDSNSPPCAGNFGLDMGFPQEPTSTSRSELPKLMDYDISLSQTLDLVLTPAFDYGFTGGSGLNMTATDPTMSMVGNEITSFPTAKQKRKKIVIVDVSRLIDGMIKRGVCLGRAPGFRRKDVDMALQAAILPTY